MFQLLKGIFYLGFTVYVSLDAQALKGGTQPADILSNGPAVLDKHSDTPLHRGVGIWESALETVTLNKCDNLRDVKFQFLVHRRDVVNFYVM
jgi:hypothetical protein